MKRLLFPIFVPLVLWSWLLILFEILAASGHPLRGTGPSYSSMMDFAAVIIALVGSAVLQIVIGVPSIRLLRHSTAWIPFVSFAVTSAVAISIVMSAALRSPGESPLVAFPVFALIFVPPFLFGYVWIRPRDSLKHRSRVD